MKFELYATYRGGVRKLRWRLRGKNGKIVANAGESYARKIDCLRSIELVRGTDAETPLVEVDG